MANIDKFETTTKDIRNFGYKMVDMLCEIWEKSDSDLFGDKILDGKRSELITQEFSNIGISCEELIEKIHNDIKPYLFNALQPRIFQLFSSPLPIPALVNSIVSFLNIQPYYEVNNILEQNVIHQISCEIGFSNHGQGIFTGGGTLSNLYALAIARVHKVGNDIRKKGIKKKLIIYASTETHSSIHKAVEILGIGSDNYRLIDVDSQYRIDLQSLENAIIADLKEEDSFPFCVVANVGSARTGSVDPIYKISEIAQKYNLWLHLDGAYGGFGAFSDKKADLFKGIERGDSLTVDPRKWLNVPDESSCLIVGDKNLFSKAFEKLDDYFDSDFFNKENPLKFSYELTRSDKALKVWAALHYYGISNYKKLISQHIEFAKKLSLVIQEDRDFELYNNPDLSICVFRYLPYYLKEEKLSKQFYINNLNKAISLTLKTNYKTLITNTKINNVLVLRVCIINYRITFEMLEGLIESIKEIGSSLDAKMQGR